MENLIVIKQLPIIEEQFKSLSAEIDEKLNGIENLECTEETVKEIKKIRADFNKEAKEYATAKKDIKDKVLAPYNEFEKNYKEYVENKYKNADMILKEKIDSVENSLKEERKQKLIEYFQSINSIDFLKFENINLNITLSASEKSLKEEVLNFVEKIKNEVNSINILDNADEIMYEYKQNLDMSKSIQIVQIRKKALEATKFEENTSKEKQEADVQVREKNEEISVDEIVTVNIQVTAEISKIRALKKFMLENNIKFE
jgi:hypothetical protein